MKLEDIYDALSTGELSQVVIGHSDNGVMEIPEEIRRQIRHSLQLGLSDLHTRFLIREKTFKLERVPDKHTYVLNSRFAVSNTNSDVMPKYVLDVNDPFQDDLIKIERIRDSKGKPVALNEIDNDDSVRTLSDTILAVPETLKCPWLEITYRANHPTLNKYVSDAAPVIVDIDLPIKYLQALLYFIASRALNPIGFKEYTHEGNNYLQKYEMECQRLMSIGAGIDSGESHGRRIDAGWA